MNETARDYTVTCAVLKHGYKKELFLCSQPVVLCRFFVHCPYFRPRGQSEDRSRIVKTGLQLRRALVKLLVWRTVFACKEQSDGAPARK